MAFLKVFSGGHERTVFLGADRVVLGRDRQCDVPLDDLKVSRRHCILEPLGGGRWRVRDLGSGNGTRVNGRTVESHDLQPEDVIELGDAKVLFSGEAAAVVGGATDAGAPPPARERASRRRESRRSHTGLWLGIGGLAVGGLILLALFVGLGHEPRQDPDEEQQYRVVMEARADADRVRFAEIFLARYPRSAHADEVRGAAAAARERLATGVVEGYDPRPEIRGLRPAEAVARLQQLLLEAPDERRPALRALLQEQREILHGQREKAFAEVEKLFHEHVERGEYSRARELWFFLRGEPDWEPIPPAFLNRIVSANGALENAAAAERARLLEDEARLEAAHDFKHAVELLRRALPRFEGTAVEKSLRERLAAAEQGLRAGPLRVPAPAASLVRVDVRQKMATLLARLPARDFAGAATGLRELAEEARKQQDPGLAEIDARARECEAAGAVQAALVAALGGGELPKEQIRKRWRVVQGGPEGVTVRTKGEEQRFAWADAPAELHLALLEVHAPKVPQGWLGLVVAAAALDAREEMLVALARGYEDDAARPALDAFVAGRLRKEAAPEGGYVVHAGEILTRREFLRRQEEQLIASLQAQLDKSYETIRGNGAFARLDKLRKRKDELDKAREYALELIFDQQKYFYPYRGTGREGEYQKVQQEVDRRVRPVREIWEAPLVASVKSTPELRRALEQFDEAVAGLRRLLIDCEEEAEEVEFLRSYVGKKFDLRSFYRTPEERELLLYSQEVVEFNTQVEGDITPVEREQVRVTNEYRMMFGRWPLRLVEKLVLSSRGHCEEMSRLGYFGHFSPTEGRKTPYDRMRLQGYEYGSSENCIAGQTSPQGAHNGWCHSSGHHRNILMPPWTEMGTGHYGRLMTQNYGQAPQWSKHDPVEEGEEGDEDMYGEPIPGWEEEEAAERERSEESEDEDLDYEEED